MENNIDIHQMLNWIINPKNEKYIKNINIVSLFNYISTYKIRKALVPKSNYHINHLVLDSANRIASVNQLSISWTYTWNTSYQLGAISSKIPIRNIVGMKIYSLHTPRQYTSLITQYGANTFSILINEFLSQSIIAHNFNYHFLLRKVANNPLVSDPLTSNYALQVDEYVPLNDGIYWFDQPIVSLDTITLTMGINFDPIVIPIAGDITDNYQIARTNPTSFVTNRNLYQIGDIVQFYNFTTANPQQDSNVIAIMNSANGHNVIGIQPGTDIYLKPCFFIYIDVDLSSVIAFNPIFPAYIPVVSNKMHMYIAMDFIYDDNEDN